MKIEHVCTYLPNCNPLFFSFNLCLKGQSIQLGNSPEYVIMYNEHGLEERKFQIVDISTGKAYEIELDNKKKINNRRSLK